MSVLDDENWRFVKPVLPAGTESYVFITSRAKATARRLWLLSSGKQQKKVDWGLFFSILNSRCLETTWATKGDAHLNYLKHYRTKHNKWTQGELAKASGISQVQISFIENGLSEPMELTKEKLAQALKVPVAELFPAKMTMHELRNYRVKKLMTQEELGRASGVSKTTISSIENGIVSEPMKSTQQKLAEALEIAPEKLFPPKKKVKAP